jgi:hypothetical protein
MEENTEGKSEQFFKDFGKKVDQFLAEAKDAANRMDAEMQKKYDELKISAERLKKEAQNKERWKEVEEGLKRAGEELEKTLKAAFKKREGR